MNGFWTGEIYFVEVGRLQTTDETVCTRATFTSETILNLLISTLQVR